MSGFAIGIDVGATNIKGAIINSYGNIVHKIVRRNPGNFNAGINVIEELVSSLLIEKNISEVFGIGIGIAGTVDFKKGKVIFSPNIKDMKNIPLKQLLEEKFKITVLIDNDVNVAALGEKWMGAGKHLNNFIMITLGTGVGGGMILNGNIYRGANYSAGEIGHQVILFNGKTCGCGSSGCLEAYCSTEALVRQAQEFINAGEETLITKEVIKGDIEPAHIFHAAAKKDKIALEIVREYSRYLGVGLANLANIFDPEAIIIGGGISKSLELMLPHIKESLKIHTSINPEQEVQIIKAELGSNAGIIGAASLILN